ncbi:hypothetical protein ACLOJK_000665 [Asimina triloba]
MLARSVVGVALLPTSTDVADLMLESERSDVVAEAGIQRGSGGGSRHGRIRHRGRQWGQGKLGRANVVGMMDGPDRCGRQPAVVIDAANGLGKIYQPDDAVKKNAQGYLVVGRQLDQSQ